MDELADDVKMEKWVCCQIGAREHYAIPHSHSKKDRLQLLITDYWADGVLNLAPWLSKNLQGRRHPGLKDDKVTSFNFSSLGFEVIARVSHTTGWERVMKRNEWFQKKVVSQLRSLKENPTHVFSYSYSAKDIFRFAKSKGWKTVLGQMDPGPLEEEIVIGEVKRYPQYKSEWQPAPKSYWENWTDECELADEIIVNSEWSYEALIQKGIAKSKIKIDPLTYTIPEEAISFQRQYPNEFNKTRPLRVLFLGQVILRKGIARVIEAAQHMLDMPVEFIIAGPVGIDSVPKLPNMKWLGRIPRLEIDGYFKNADVFLFPTLSDGFGLTQLEARAWKLPLIVSENCGRVVNDQKDGWLLKGVNSNSIKDILCGILNRPDVLKHYSRNISDYAGRA